MRIAINISPLSSGHKFRGTGSYTRLLYENLPKFDKENTYLFFDDINKLPKNIDIIHYPFFDPFSFSFSIRHLGKTLITIHDLIPLVFPKYFPCGIKGEITWNLQKLLLKNIKGVITDSKTSKKDIVYITGVPEEKVNVVYLAAEKTFTKIANQESQINNLKKKYNLPDKFLLYVGDITWNKNIPNLIRAVKTTSFPLILVGKVWSEEKFDKNNTWNRDRVLVESLIQNNKQFIRMGFVPTEDIVQLYNAASIFIMPSFYEGFGLPVLEAMQCGCPVITTDKGSLKEIAGNAAYIINPEDIKSIAGGIENIVNNKTLQKELSDRGLKQAKKFFLENTIRNTITVYKKYK